MRVARSRFVAHVHAGFVGAEALLGAEVRYVDEAGAAVVTTLGELAVERVSKALPVRRIPSHAGQRHRPGLFWSATTGGHVPYESRLELDRLWLADFDPDVVDHDAADVITVAPRQPHRHGHRG